MEEKATQWLNLILSGVAAVAMVVTAYASIRTWRSRRREVAVGKPTITASPRLAKRPDDPHRISFRIDDEHLQAWRINSVSAWPLWTPLISALGKPIQDELGGIITYRIERWSRRITYDPPIHSSEVLLRRDCPSMVVLVFKMSLRATQSEVSRCPVRIKIKD